MSKLRGTWIWLSLLTKVDITVEETQSASVNIHTLESNHEVHIEVQNSERAVVSVQLLDSVCASVSANVIESEHATVNVKILGSTDTTTTSSAHVGVMAEYEPVCAAETSFCDPGTILTAL